MNRIESGTTGERWVRCLVFVGLFAVFGAWFAYDGWIRYPAKNLQWAKENMPARPAGAPPVKASINPNVTTERVKTIIDRLSVPGVTLSRAQLVNMLGQPVYENRETGELFFIGPAVWVRVRLEGEVVRQPTDIEANDKAEYSEKEINSQKRLSIILAVVVIIALVQFVRILTTRVLLDDEGLNYNGRLVTWEAMSALDSARYRDKGWVELEYKDGEETAVLRIDNYKVRAFKEILNAICERKGFPNPLIEREEAEAPESASSTEPPEDSAGQ